MRARTVARHAGWLLLLLNGGPAHAVTVVVTPEPKAPAAAALVVPAAAPQAAPKAEPKAEPKAAPQAAPQAAPKAEPKTAPQAAPKAEPKAAPQATAPVTATPEAAEYALWSTLVAQGLGAEAKTIVIAAHTSKETTTVVPFGSNIEDLAKRLETTPSLLNRWLAMNEAASGLERHFELSMNYELLGETERTTLFADPDPATNWRQFKNRFPDAPGLLRLSRVAFDATAQNALVYVEFNCGATCGSGRLIRAHRVGKTWSLQSGELIWIAGP